MTKMIHCPFPAGSYMLGVSPHRLPTTCSHYNLIMPAQASPKLTRILTKYLLNGVFWE